jgi:flagellar hook-length control protein FliK
MESQVELLNMSEALPILQEMTGIVEKHVNLANENQAHVNLWTQSADALTNAESELVNMGELALGDLAEGEETPDLTANVASARSSQAAQTAAEAQTEQAPVAVQQADVQTHAVPEVAANPLPVAESNTAAAQTATAAPMQAAATPQSVAEQIVQNVRYISVEQMAEIRIQLKPDHLGELSLRIATHNGVVTAQFLAENQRVKELIEAGFSDLKDALEQAGINISDIEVNVSTGENQGDFDEEGSISDKRIRDLMDAALAEEAEQVVMAKEENLVDYRI